MGGRCHLSRIDTDRHHGKLPGQFLLLTRLIEGQKMQSVLVGDRQHFVEGTAHARLVAGKGAGFAGH